MRSVRCFAGLSSWNGVPRGFRIIPTAQLQRRLMSTIGEKARDRGQESPMDVLQEPATVMKEEEEFKFGCTACGACCFSNVENISITPFDIYNMSRSPWLSFLKDKPYHRGKPVDSTSSRRHLLTTELRRYFPGAFRVGLVNLGEYEDQSAFGIHCSLYPREFGEDTGACHFAYPLVPQVTGEESTMVSETQFLNFEAFAQADNDRSPARLYESRIVCGLGSKHQPTACSLYPLQQVSLREYQLDVRNCEGVGHDAAPTISIQDYLKDQKMTPKTEATEWFAGQQSKLCYYQFYEEFAAFGERGGAWDAFVGDAVITSFYNIVEGLFYDFDSLKCAPKDGFTSWEDTAKGIEDGVDLIVEHGQKLDVSSTEAACDTFLQFVTVMEEYGVTRESFVNKLDVS